MTTRNLPSRFILYRREWDSVAGKWQKHPCDTQGHNIDPHQSRQWRTYDDAARYAQWDETRPGTPYGVGFVLNGDGFFLLDIDGALDANGQWTAESQGIFLSFGGALGEVSTSGKGLHVIGRCDPTLPETHKNKWDGDKEFYTDGRFVALSQGGLSVIGGGEYTEQDWTHLLRRLIPERPYLGELPDGRDPSYTGPEDDEELIAMMLRSSSAANAFGGGVTVRDLWEGNAERLATKYPDPERVFDASAADSALMSHLAFWTGKDMPRMDRLFRRSALMRDKYERREDYRRDTIQKAARLTSAVFSRRAVVADADRSESEEWEPLPPHYAEPERLQAPKLEPHAFLTSSLADWVVEAAEAKCAPVDFVFWTLLSVSSSLIGNARRACPNPSWSQPVSLWTICVGNPSSGKSPAMDAILDPLRAVEKPLKDQAARDREAWEAKKQLAEMAEAVWKKSAKAALSDDATPPPMPDAMQIGNEPHIPRLMITDSTIEKLAMICQRQPKGVLQVRDELAGWLHGMSRYSSGSDRPFWLEANGGRNYTVERVGREPVNIPHLLVTVLGGIQPDRLKSLLLDGDDDGLVARLLPIWPDRLAALKDVERYEDRLIRDIFNVLDGIEMPYDNTGQPMPLSVSFEDDARPSFRAFRERLRALEATERGLMLSFLGKLPGVTVTLALLRAYLRWAETGAGCAPSKIGGEDVTTSIVLVENYVLPMARRTYAAFDVAKAAAAVKVILNVVTREKWEEFTKRDLHRTLGKKISSAKDLDAPLKELLEIGAIREITPQSSPQGGRRSCRYVVNPHVHSQGRPL